jgi:hypothetical protein
MSVEAVAGHPDYSTGGTSNFIPQLFSGKLITKFYSASVFPDISNTDYEGEIKDMGDSVTIRTVPDITINDYKKGQKLDYERPESPSVELLIDKGKYFGAVCDDVDKLQSDIPLMDKWAEDASEQMKIAIDTGILADVYADASSDNTGQTAGAKSSAFDLGVTGTPEAITKSNVLDYLVDCGTVLDEQNMPESDRFIVIPAWMAGLIKKSDLKDASLTGDGSSTLRNGKLGMIDRFMLYISNNLTAVSDSGTSSYNMIFGHKSALTFASQLVKMETLKAESTFGELIRGLQVYGYKVVKPESMGVLYGYKG